MKKIQKTENYDLFKRILGNRTINKAQVGRLQESFGNHPELTEAVPIIVNDKMEIIDGQHRFRALKNLKLPIYYFKMKGMGLSSIQIINSATKNWTPLDYAKSFHEKGIKSYTTYLQFKRKYKFSHSILVLYLSGVSRSAKVNTKTRFNLGKFEVGNIAEAQKLSDNLMEIKEYYPKADRRAFATAFKVAASNKKYKQDRMVAKIKLYGDRFLVETDNPEERMRQIENIYNYRCKEGAGRVKLF